MSVRRPSLAWAWWGGILVVLAATLTFSALNGNFSTADDLTFLPMAATMVLGYATVGALISSRIPGNPTGPLMMGVAAGFVSAGFSSEYSQYAIGTASLPFGTAIAWLSNLVWFPVIALLMTLLAVFPTGGVPSPRWRWLPRAFLGVTGFGLVVVALHPAPLVLDDGTELANPTGVAALESVTGATLSLVGASLAVLSVSSIAAMVLRFRRARGVERQQLRLLAYVVAVSGAILALSLLTGLLGLEAASNVAFYFLFAGFGIGVPVAMGVAILKYRLYDIDVVINKTLVYGALAAFITLVYLALVVGVGTRVGRGSSFLTMAAAVIVAVTFQPLRERIRRVANRVVYGSRSTPYEVLSEFSHRMGEAYAAEDLLPRMARILAEGTRADRAEVWLAVGREIRLAATWPAGTQPRSLPLAGQDLPRLEDVDAGYPVRHEGELLGALAVRKPRGEPLTPTEEKLVADLAAQAGLVLRNVRLVEDLRASRQRLVKAQDEERRRLERNIHDGAQQQLVALAVKLGLADSLVGRDEDRERDLLRELRTETQAALEDLRDLARGIYPPLLADQGLPAALQAQARRAAIPVEVHSGDIGRYPPEAEAAVYFSVLEALQNTAKYARATRATVTLSAHDGALAFEVRDDGVGFDPEATSYGTGLQGMADRLEALGGSLTVTSRPGGGTSVSGTLPFSPSIQAGDGVAEDWDDARAATGGTR